MTYPFYTIGHSTRPIAEFAGLLKGAEVALVADVRSIPRSRTNPQYNCNTLPRTLAEFGMGYEHIAALGGLRSKERGVPAAVNAFWQNQSFHNYADFAMGEEFREGLARLSELGQLRRCAIMCAEALWWRCHRRIIADYLIAAGGSVFHIIGAQHVQPARMTKAARLTPSGVITYPAGR